MEPSWWTWLFFYFAIGLGIAEIGCDLSKPKERRFGIVYLAIVFFYPLWIVIAVLMIPIKNWNGD